MKEKDKWHLHAKNILKSELARKGFKYHDLARRLQDLGIDENQNSIATKVSRGTFPFTFFIQCMYVLGVENIDLKLEDI
jgi:hypothetical protein